MPLELQGRRDQTAADVPGPVHQRKELQALMRIELGIDLRQQSLERAAELAVEPIGFALLASLC